MWRRLSIVALTCGLAFLAGAAPAPAPTTAPANVETQAIRRPAAPGGTAAKATSARSGDYLQQVGIALVAVIALVLLLRAGARWLMPGTAPSGGGGAMQVLTRLTISPRQQLLLVRVGKQVLVLGSSGAELRPLGQISDPDEAARLIGQAQQGGGFAKAISHAESGFADEAADAGVEPVESAPRGEVATLMEKVRGLRQRFKQT